MKSTFKDCVRVFVGLNSRMEYGTTDLLSFLCICCCWWWYYYFRHNHHHRCYHIPCINDTRRICLHTQKDESIAIIVIKIETVTHTLGLYTVHYGRVRIRQQFAHYSAVGSVEKLFCNKSQNVCKSSGEAPFLFRCLFMSNKIWCCIV